MSNTQNTLWLENAKDNFEQAIAEGNWEQASAVISDVGDAGFENEALKLHQEYNDKIREWAIADNYREDLAAGHEDPRDYADRYYP